MQGQKVLIAFGPSDPATLASELAQIPDRGKLESRGEGCGAEGTGEPEEPAPPSRYWFNATSFSHTYSEATSKLNANQTLDNVDFQSLYAAATGAPLPTLASIEQARWLTEHGLGAQAVHPLANAYQLAVQNYSVVCLPQEAEQLDYFLQYQDYARVGPQALHLKLDLLPAFLQQMGQSNNSKVYAAVNATEAVAQVRALTTAIAAGQYASAPVRQSLDYLKKLPC
jgi:hypothetical protein